MPTAIDEIAVVAAEEAKKPQRPIVFGGVNKEGKPILRKVVAVPEDLPEEEKEYKEEYFGAEQDDALVEAGLLPPIDKKLLGLT